MKVGEYEIPEDLYYSKEHEWLRAENSNSRVGISDYAQKALHEVVFVDLPEKGLRVNQMQSLGTVESVKAVADVYSPISGEIVEVNTKLLDTPELINQSPYDEGWLVLLKPSNYTVEIKNLMDSRSYADFVRGLIERK